MVSDAVLYFFITKNIPNNLALFKNQWMQQSSCMNLVQSPVYFCGFHQTISLKQNFPLDKRNDDSEPSNPFSSLWSWGDAFMSKASTPCLSAKKISLLSAQECMAMIGFSESQSALKGTCLSLCVVYLRERPVALALIYCLCMHRPRPSIKRIRRIHIYTQESRQEGQTLRGLNMTD